ncbi:MAG: DUF4240 domain-containing protein [Ktedonobacterales bacterium]
MDEGRFWTLVAESQGDAYRLKRLLVRLSREDILAFDMRLDDALYHLDRRNIHAITDGSDDGFLYVRLWIVSRGRQYYESVLRDPENAPHYADEEANEEFMYAAMGAFEEKFGEPWPARPHKRGTGAKEAS